MNVMKMPMAMWAMRVMCGLQLTAAAWAQDKAVNPVIHADVPDIAMVRVGNDYYMSSTTMHFSPGLPVMKSTDLVNWRTVAYGYGVLDDVDDLNLASGRSTYGKGSWASSIRHHDGTFYVTTFAQTTGKTYVYRTKDIENGPWRVDSFKPMLHDHSLFFDDDGRVYMLYGAGDLRLVELNREVTGLQPGGFNEVVIRNATAVAGPNTGLPAEGSQMIKHAGKYYVFNITWPRGGMRTVLVHRADRITGPYEGRVALQDKGVAQGSLIDTPDGRWFAYLFQDSGAVGRIPYLVPVTWKDGWPEIGINGKVPATLDLPPSKGLIPGIVASDEFTRAQGDRPLPLAWQWNHNPDNHLWSLSARPGYLRLTTGRVDADFLAARNTLTQRTFGPECSGETAVDVRGLKDGDFAGLGLLQKNYGLAGVKMEGGKKHLVMVNAQTGTPVEAARLPLNSDVVMLRADCDFRDKADIARFSYSLDGRRWEPLGDSVKMAYTIPHFIGYRFGLFQFATREAGGHADFDYFRVSNRMGGGDRGAARPGPRGPRGPSEPVIPRDRGQAAGPDDKPAFDPPPPGFNVRKEGVPQGKLEMVEYDSKTVGTKRRMQVYTPPGYTPEKRYPVLYLLHGIGGDETEWQRFVRVDQMMDNLIAAGKAVPMIVVMPNGRARKNDRAEGDVFASAPAFATFEQDLLDDVIPAIDARYRTQEGPGARALAGLSMGGGQTLNFGLAHLDTFAWLGAFSAAPNTKPAAELVPDPSKTAAALKLFMLTCGNKDGLMRISRGVHDHLKQHQIPHVWHVDDNGHDPTHWGSCLHAFAQRIFR